MAANGWQWAGAWVAAGVLAAAALGGCDAPAGGEAAGVRADVTDVRPGGRFASAAGPAAAGPAVYDMSGIIPTAPQPLTEPAAVPATDVVAPSPVMFAPTPAVTAGRTHVVRRGETLFAIAKTEYGNGKQWNRLADANPAASRGLRVGQRLLVP